MSSLPHLAEQTSTQELVQTWGTLVDVKRGQGHPNRENEQGKVFEMREAKR